MFCARCAQTVAARGAGATHCLTQLAWRPAALLVLLVDAGTGQCARAGWHAPPKAPRQQQLQGQPSGQQPVLPAAALLSLAQAAAAEGSVAACQAAQAQVAA